MKRRVKLTQFQILELCSRFKQRYAQLHPSASLNLNTNPANYRELAGSINEGIGEDRISDTWLRDLVVYAANEEKGKVLSAYQLEALHDYIDGGDKMAQVRLKEVDKRLRGRYRFLWRGTRLEKEIIDNLVTFYIEFSEDEITFSEAETGASYFKHHHLFLNGIDYIALMDQHYSEIVFLTLHRGQAYARDLNVIPGFFLGTDTGYLPCAGPVLLVKEEIDYNEEFINRFFEDYDFTSVKGKSITEVSGYDRALVHPKATSKAAFRNGLVGEWLSVCYVPWDEGFLVSHLTIGSNSIYYESLVSLYHRGSVEIIGERSLAISLQGKGRGTTFISDIGNYRKTDQIRQFAAALTCSASSRPSYGYTLFFRTSQLVHKLPVGPCSQDGLQAAGIEKALLENLRKNGLQELPQISNV